MRIFAFFLAFLLASNAGADDLLIDMTADDAFNTMVANVNVGQTVTWRPIAKGHNIEFVKGPTGAKLLSKSKLSQQVSVKFTVPGVYLYWCSPHKDTGMIGLIVVENDLGNLSEIAEVEISRQSDSVLRALITSLD